MNPFFKKEINHFSDLTDLEFSSLYLTGLKRPERPAHHKLKSSPIVVAAENVPAAINWKDKGVVTVPENQGSCGSCWAFTTAATVESANAIKHDITNPEKLSV